MVTQCRSKPQLTTTQSQYNLPRDTVLLQLVPQQHASSVADLPRPLVVMGEAAPSTVKVTVEGGTPSQHHTPDLLRRGEEHSRRGHLRRGEGENVIIKQIEHTE